MGSSVISTTTDNSEQSINPCQPNQEKEKENNNHNHSNHDNNHDINNNNINHNHHNTDYYSSETPTERNDRIKALFDSLDKKQEGVLDRECIEKGLTAMTHLPARTKFVNELLAQCDTSQDGLVDFEEFKTYVHEKEKELWQLFQRMDTRGDGSLLPSDLAAALQTSGITVTQEELMEFVQWMDLDGNGVIDFYEFKNFLLLLPETKVSEIYRYYETSTQLTQDAEVIIPPTDETSHHALRYLLAGGIAGAVSRTCTAPFDRLKVYLITNSSQTKPLTIREAIKIIYTKSGWRGFFVGNGLNIFKIVPESAMKFYSYETFKGLFAKALNCEDKDSIPTSARFLAGGMAGLCSQFLIYPVETLKTRIMSLQRETTGCSSSGKSIATSASSPSIPTSSSLSPSSSYSTVSLSNTSPSSSSFIKSSITSRFSQSIVLNTMKSMYARAGLRAFWPGLTLGLVGVFPYQAMDLGIYETLKLGYLRYTDEGNLHSNKPKQPNVLVLWSCGMISGSIGATSVYPLNVIRTRLQAQGTPAHPRYYTSPWNCVQVTFQTEGIRGFYKGLGPTLFKVVPAVSISYITYEWSKRELGIS